MLTVFGSTALDTIRTPSKILKDTLGGAATYASISAGFCQAWTNCCNRNRLSKKYYKILAKHLDLKGLSINEGKTFRYSGRYDSTLSSRMTLRTDLNVLRNFKPVVPEDYKNLNLYILPITILTKTPN